jgi:hypothetical protein
MLIKLNRCLTGVSIFLTMAALIAGMAGCTYNPPSPNLEIRTWYDLDAVKSNLTGNYTLINNLDSTTLGYYALASPTANGGKGWQPIGALHQSFTGSFDGQGYEIRDLYINRPDEDNVGLFGFVNLGGRIEDAGVINANVTGNQLVGGLVGDNAGTVSNSHSSCNVTGNQLVGGLVGYNKGTIDNSYVTGSVSGESCIGGLVGLHDHGTVSASWSSCNVSGQISIGGLIGTVSYATVSDSYSSCNVTGNSTVGGLVGGNLEGAVESSYSTANVTGTEYVGGLVGMVGSTIYTVGGTVNNSYSTGSVTGNSTVGGLVGGNREYGGVVTSSFWDVETSGQATSAGGMGKNTTEMKDIATFSGAAWNITTVALNETNPAYIWNMVNNVTYPFLSWQL